MVPPSLFIEISLLLTSGPLLWALLILPCVTGLFFSLLAFGSWLHNLDSANFFFLNLKTDSVLFNLPGATAVDTFPRKEEIQPSGPAIRSHRENDLKGSRLGDCDGSLAI